MGLSCFDLWEMKYVSRKSNYAAHLMARYAKFIITIGYGWKISHLLLLIRFY